MSVPATIYVSFRSILSVLWVWIGYIDLNISYKLYICPCSKNNKYHSIKHLYLPLPGQPIQSEPLVQSLALSFPQNGHSFVPIQFPIANS